MPTIIHGRYALRKGVAHENLAICVDGSIIVDCGALADLVDRYPGVDKVGGDNFVVAPALTNAHDHGRGLGTLALGVPDYGFPIWQTFLPYPRTWRRCIPGCNCFNLA